MVRQRVAVRERVAELGLAQLEDAGDESVQLGVVNNRLGTPTGTLRLATHRVRHVKIRSARPTPLRSSRPPTPTSRPRPRTSRLRLRTS